MEHIIKDTADQVNVGLFHSILFAISNLPPPQVRRNKRVRGTFDFILDFVSSIISNVLFTS